MSYIKLFRLANGSVAQLTGTSVAVEKLLQHLIEKYLDEFLGVTFLETQFTFPVEYSLARKS